MLDWSHDQDVYSQFEDWIEECKLILGGPLKALFKAEKSIYVRL